MGLNGKANSLINSILKQDSYNSRVKLNFNKEFESKYLEVLEKILSHLSSKYPSQQKLETLIAYLSVGASEELQETLGEDYDIPNRLSDVKERTKSFNNSQRFPYAWSFWIEKYSSEVELLSFLDKGLIYEKLQKSPGLITNLYSSFPKDKEKRGVIIKAFEKLKNEKNFYAKDQAIRIYSNEKLVNYLKKEKMSFEKPLFSVKKKHYQRGFDNGDATLYSIFNLIRLGIFKDEFLEALYASRL